MANCGAHSLFILSRFLVFHSDGKVQFAFLMSSPTTNEQHSHDINRVNNKYVFYALRTRAHTHPPPLQ